MSRLNLFKVVGHADFIVKYNPDVDTPEDLTKKILYSIWVRRLKFNKPVVIFVGGDSGEGKTLTIVKLQEILCDIQGIEFRSVVKDINVFTPIEYPDKLRALLDDKRLKKVNMIAMHEARDIVKAKMWQSFIATAVADVNAQVRSVKRLCIFIGSQFIRDITNDMRYTLNYYVTVKRLMGGNRKAHARISVLWKDDRDLEKPKLRKRRISGFLVYPDGRYRRYTPKYLEVTKPDKDIVEIVETADREAKVGIIRNKLDRMIKEMRLELEEGDAKIKAMIKFYTGSLERLESIGKRSRGKWRVNKDFEKMHDLSRDEVKKFQDGLNEQIKSMDVLGDDSDGV